jgi:anti-anti-sigma factor
VAVSGEVREDDVSRPRDPLEALLGARSYGRQVLLDLSGVEAIDSSGIAWLVRRQRHMRQSGGELILHSASPPVSQILKKLRMDRVFSIADDRESAFALARHGIGAAEEVCACA